MRIHNPFVSQVQKAYNKNQKLNVQGTEKVIKKDDGVELSTEAGLFSIALNALKQMPQEERDIDYLKNAVKTGTYKVSNQDVAEKILAESILDKKV